jgi:CTP synthase (UTP-ammonia lyase)
MAGLAILGDRNLTYPTHRELDAVLALLPPSLDARWVASDSAEAQTIDRFDGVWVVPGSPYRDDDAVLAAIGVARRSGLPLLGTCGGFQYAVLEFAREVAGLDAAHAELDRDAEQPVIAQLACSLVGQERTVTTVPGTRLAAICGEQPFTGFHWCSFGLADAYVERLEAHGLVISARADDAGVEGIELPSHPFFLATLFQPQVGSLAGKPLHPLLAAFAAVVG